MKIVHWQKILLIIIWLLHINQPVMANDFNPFANQEINNIMYEAAQKGDIHAQAYLAAQILRNNLHHDAISIETAQQWLENAFKQYDGMALTYYGQILESNGEYEQAAALYEDFIQNGTPLSEIYAQARLGRLYYRGWGVPKNNEKAKEYFLKSYSAKFATLDIVNDYAELYWEELDFMRSIDINARIAMHGHLHARTQLAQKLRYFHSYSVNVESLRYPSPKFGLWYILIQSSAEMNLDYRLGYSPQLAYLWSVIYEYGIGVPKNLVVAQALNLYSEKSFLESKEDMFKAMYKPFDKIT